MEFSVVPYTGNSPMKLWPSLADKAFYLRDASRPEEAIFYYDSTPVQTSALQARAEILSPPVIVLIHGLGDEADSWRHLIPLLSSRFRVLALDLPGFGRSIAPGKISLKGHAAAVLKLLEGLGIGKEGAGAAPPVFLAGNSMGAVVAEAAALGKPGLAHGLILIDGCIPGGPSSPGLFTLAKTLFSRKWYRAYRNDPESLWASLYPYYADLDALPQEDRDFLRRRVMERVESPTQEQAYFSTYRNLVRMYLCSSSWFSRKIRNFEGKILLLWGEKDKIIPLSSTEAFRNIRSGIELKIIPGAGHLPHQEKPVETAQIMAEWCYNDI